MRSELFQPKTSSRPTNLDASRFSLIFLPLISPPPPPPPFPTKFIFFYLCSPHYFFLSLSFCDKRVLFPLFQEVTREWGVRGGVKQRTVHLVVTPAVVREVRAHFNCPDLEGAELEDQVGLDGVEQGTTLCTSSSHPLWLGRSGPTSTAQNWKIKWVWMGWNRVLHCAPHRHTRCG